MRVVAMNHLRIRRRRRYELQGQSDEIALAVLAEVENTLAAPTERCRLVVVVIPAKEAGRLSAAVRV
jgi:hypothetical protein